MTDQPPQFPQYQPPTVATHKQSAPLTRMIGKMIPAKLKPKLFGRAKGIKADQSVHIKHRNPVKYW